MNIAGIRIILSAAVLSAVLAATQPVPLAAQAKPAFNLTKEVLDKKTIVWTNAPSNAIPTDVCNILAACGGQAKVMVIPRGADSIVRGLFLSEDSKHNPVVLLERRSLTDEYFFLLSPDGGLQKAAYTEVGKGWLAMATSLAQTPFQQDTKIWHDHVAKLGAPAAPAAQGN